MRSLAVLALVVASLITALAPGRYGVRTTARVVGRTPQPSTVTVRRQGYARVKLRIDTGIR